MCVRLSRIVFLAGCLKQLLKSYLLHETKSNESGLNNLFWRFRTDITRDCDVTTDRSYATTQRRVVSACDGLMAARSNRKLVTAVVLRTSVVWFVLTSLSMLPVAGESQWTLFWVKLKQVFWQYRTGFKTPNTFVWQFGSVHRNVVYIILSNSQKMYVQVYIILNLNAEIQSINFSNLQLNYFLFGKVSRPSVP